DPVCARLPVAVAAAVAVRAAPGAPMEHHVTAHALTVRELRATRGSTPVLRGVDLDVAAGEICALMGVSGAGKPGVLRAIVALQRGQHCRGRVRAAARPGAARVATAAAPKQGRLRVPGAFAVRAPHGDG